MSTKKTSLLKEIRSDYAFATILKVNCVPTFLTHFRKLFFENNPKLFRVLLQRCHDDDDDSSTPPFPTTANGYYLILASLQTNICEHVRT